MSRIKKDMRGYFHFHPIDILLIAMLIGPLAIPLAGRMPKLFWTDVVVVLLIAATILKTIVPGQKPSFRTPRFIRWMIPYIIIIIATLAFSRDFLVSIAIAKLYILPLVLFLLAYNYIQKEADIEHLVVMIALVGLFFGASSLFNWYKFYTGAAELQPGLGTKDMIQTVTGRSNTVAGVNAIIIPIVLFLIFDKRLLLKTLGIISLSLLVISIIFAMSRAAILALGVGLIFWLLTMFRTKLIFTSAKRILGPLFIIAIIISLAWRFMPFDFQNMLIVKFKKAYYQTVYFPLSNDRLVRWQICITHIPDAPFGIGVGNYIPIMSPLNPNMGESAHNFYIETFVEIGIVGFLALLGILIGYGKKLTSLHRLARTKKQRILACSLIMAYVIFLVDIFFEPNYYSVTFMYLFSLFIAMAFVLVKTIKSSTAEGIIKR